ncbi:MAG: hypothetical protein WD738_06925 [Pirellulales bacterium]
MTQQKRGSFKAKDAAGKEYTIEKWFNMREVDDLATGTTTLVEVGVPRLQLADGTEVRWVSTGVYDIQLATTIRVTSADPTAP